MSSSLLHESLVYFKEAEIIKVRTKIYSTLIQLSEKFIIKHLMFKRGTATVLRPKVLIASL